MIMPRFANLRLVSVVLLLWTLPTTAVRVTNIRLRNGNAPSTRVGRIEIQVDNVDTWGSICDDGWGNEEAIVACRMLGFTNGGVPVTDGRYGQGNFLFLMDDSRCTGDESSLTECISSQQSDCTAQTDSEAGVECNENLGPGQPTPTPPTTTTASSSVISGNCQATNPTVSLYGKTGVDGMGYVQAQAPDGRVGFVCDDGWNEAAAKVVCAQLCYPTNYTAKPGIPSEHKLQPPNNILIVLDDLNCAGTEATLQDCPHGEWFVNDCLDGDGELAGVQCVEAEYEPPPPPVPILECGNGLLVAQFLRSQDPNLEEKHLSVFSQPNCPDVTKSKTDDYVTISIGVESCGTNVSRNSTHIIYYNEVKYDHTSIEGYITRVNTYRVKLTCALPITKQVTQRVQPLTEAVTQASVGNFQLGMEIFRSDSFTTPVADNPVQIPLGEWLNMAIAMEETDSRLELVVTDCVTTPTGDTTGTVKKVLFENKCSQEPTLSFYPLTNYKYGFRFKPFKFVGYELLYVHCDAIICLARDNTEECDRTCNNEKPNVTDTASTGAGRKKRSPSVVHARVESRAIILYDPHAPGPDFGTKEEEVKTILGPNDIIKEEPQEQATEKPTQPVQNEKPPELSQDISNGGTNSDGKMLGDNAGYKASSTYLQIFFVMLVILCLF